MVQNLKSPYPALEGERIAGCRVPVAVTLPALAAEQDVADPEGEKLYFKTPLLNVIRTKLLKTSLVYP